MKSSVAKTIPLKLLSTMEIHSTQKQLRRMVNLWNLMLDVHGIWVSKLIKWSQRINYISMGLSQTPEFEFELLINQTGMSIVCKFTIEQLSLMLEGRILKKMCTKYINLKWKPEKPNSPRWFYHYTRYGARAFCIKKLLRSIEVCPESNEHSLKIYNGVMHKIPLK